ncbi:MAG TPA: carboxypeptidase-like regulatory domain-containing protein, partial [Vicinamibacteria bacterium]
MRSRSRWLAALVGSAMMLPASALGQTQNAELNGRVRDPSGLPLPGATITLAESATGFSRTAVSQEDGAYILSNLRPGTYDVTVEMQGFGTLKQTGLAITAGAELTVNFDLELATIEEVITVTGETPLIELTSSRIGGTLATQEIDSVPTNFRQFA